MENMRFKVGDRVRIKSLNWYNENNVNGDDILENIGIFPFFPYMAKFCGQVLTIKDIHPTYYTMEETNYYTCWTDEMIEGLVEEGMSLDKAGQITDFEYEGLAYTLPEGYQFVDENGNVINATKIVLEKKKKAYPKTFEECCKILGLLNVDLCFNADYSSFDASKEQWKRLGLMNQFYQLLICRDAYWKLYGEEMGLGKPWEPDWTDENQEKYIIGSWLGTIQGLEENFVSHPFAFPTEKMRDAFYENFKEFINECKELL